MNTTPFLAKAVLAFILISVGIPGVSKLQAADNLIVNPGFEDGQELWTLYVSGDKSGCELVAQVDSPHAGKGCIEMKSAQASSFSISPVALANDQKVAAVVPGDRWKLTFCFRAADGTVSNASPGFFVRFPLLKDWKKLPALVFVGLNGSSVTQGVEASLDIPEIAADLPTKWTKVESVFEVPAEVGANQLGRPEFYARGLLGSVFLDDISLERVGAETPLSPASKSP